MGFCRGLRTVVYKLDFFYTAEVLRYREEPQSRTIFGGLLSITIIIILLTTFYSKVLNTFQKVIITSSLSVVNANDPVPYTVSTMPGHKFMFGVELWHHNLNDPNKRFFNVQMLHAHYNTGEYNTTTTVNVPLEPCKKQHWKEYPTIVQSYDRLKMADWLCLPLNSNFQINGKYSSSESKSIDVEVRKCTNSSIFSVPCAPQSEIDQLFANETNFYYTIYFINPLINADSENFISYYLQDSNYVIFTATEGEECQLMLEDYDIVTDQSILPIADYDSVSGGIVTKNCIKNRYTVDPNDQLYATMFIYKSPISRSIGRSYQKMDEILSYIGGLFGTIAICLFLVNLYNSYQFEITLGSYLFKPDNQQTGKKLRKYNFFYFLLHLVYIIIDLFGCKCEWPLTKLYYDCREQMVKQLDVLYLYRRVVFLEKAMGKLMTEKQMSSILLMEKKTLAEARKDRRKFKWSQENFLYRVGNARTDFISEPNQTLIRKENQENVINIKSPRNQFAEGVFDFSENEEPERKLVKQNSQMIIIPSELHQSSDSDEDERKAQQEQLLKQVYELKQEAKQVDLSAKIWESLSKNVRILTESHFKLLKLEQSGYQKQIFEKIKEVSKDDKKQQRFLKLPSIANTEELSLRETRKVSNSFESPTQEKIKQKESLRRRKSKKLKEKVSNQFENVQI